jgi:ureidoglycolate hydrolase
MLSEYGALKKFVVDEYIPFEYGIPCFSSDEKKSGWIMILEKAMAKFFGSYKALERAKTSEILNVLSGAPTKNYIIENSNDDAVYKLKTIIDRSLKKSFVITIATRTQEQIRDKKIISELTKQGLVFDHTYVVLKIVEFMQLDGKGVKMIALKKCVNIKKNEDLYDKTKKRIIDFSEIKSAEQENGVLYLEYSDFGQAFSSLQVCKVLNNPQSSTFNAFFTPETSSFTINLNVQANGMLYVTAQQDYESLNYEKNDFKYLRLRMTLMKKINSERTELVKEKFGQAQSLSMKYKFDRGTYVINISLEDKIKYAPAIRLNVYGEK